MERKVVVIALAAALIILLGAEAGPIYLQNGLLSYLQPTQRPPRSYHQQAQTPRKGRSRYDQICRVHNPNPFAFPGKAPFPAQPLCSYAG